jgi:hypothetical protein
LFSRISGSSAFGGTPNCFAGSGQLGKSMVEEMSSARFAELIEPTINSTPTGEAKMLSKFGFK